MNKKELEAKIEELENRIRSIEYALANFRFELPSSVKQLNTCDCPPNFVCMNAYCPRIAKWS